MKSLMMGVSLIWGFAMRILDKQAAVMIQKLLYLEKGSLKKNSSRSI
tara:strand:- start:121 stop:261 length:141 start_codon:yes stop_codon:yes gene_type:complete